MRRPAGAAPGRPTGSAATWRPPWRRSGRRGPTRRRRWSPGPVTCARPHPGRGVGDSPGRHPRQPAGRRHTCTSRVRPNARRPRMTRTRVTSAAPYCRWTGRGARRRPKQAAGLGHRRRARSIPRSVVYGKWISPARSQLPRRVSHCLDVRVVDAVVAGDPDVVSSSPRRSFSQVGRSPRQGGSCNVAVVATGRSAADVVQLGQVLVREGESRARDVLAQVCRR